MKSTTTTTQCGRILQHLEKNRSITAIQALEMYGCFRLASRIYDLKKRGFTIEKEMVERVNRYNEKVLVAQYKLVP